MDFDKLFPGRFVKAADLNGKDATLTISAVVVDELIGDKGTETKGLISFQGAKKQLVLNKTNGLCLKQMFGRETDAWIGKRITIYPTTFNDEPCIRIKGSPDLEKDITFELKLPRKKPKATTLKKTGAAPKQAEKPAAEKDEPSADHWDAVDAEAANG
jgi:hypothetical protein